MSESKEKKINAKVDLSPELQKRLIRVSIENNIPIEELTFLDKELLLNAKSVPKDALNQYEQNSLIAKIEAGNCILVLGPYFSATWDTENRFQKIAHQLAGELARELDHKECINKNNLHQVAQQYIFENKDIDELKDKSREVIKNLVEPFKKREEEKRVKDSTYQNLYTKLTALPFKLVISSCYDDLISWGFLQNGKPNTLRYHRFNAKNDKIHHGKAGTKENPMIYYLYGSYVEEDFNYQAMVLTDQERIKFLAGLLSAENKLPDPIAEELKNKRNKLLFMGFDFNHWYLRFLLHIIDAERKGSRNLAFNSPIPSDMSTLVFYKEGLTLDFYDVNPLNFVDELYEAYQNNQSRDLIPDGPKVFISYCHEDEEVAQDLNKTFRNNLIRGWVDNVSLRPADEFNNAIEASITSECDYFVSIRTKNYNDNRYAAKESEIALKRYHKQYRAYGYRFMFIINAGYHQPDEKIHETKYEYEEIAKLVQEIKMDWERRTKK